VVFSVKISADFDKEFEVFKVAGSRNSKKIFLLLCIELDK
jgi:hypothetical protein